VQRQGRLTGFGGTSVIAWRVSNGVLAAAGSAFTSNDGYFSLSVPLYGTYIVQAIYPGYVTAHKGNIYLATSSVYIGPTVLRGGDVNRDQCVNVFDLVAISAWSNHTAPPAPDDVDINDDGWVNVFDLTLASTNFGWCGVTPW
jgi:hypothetical protein